jgi:SOS-response transcriptional repressor LexA
MTRAYMTPVQKEIYMIIETWWQQYGFGPSIDDIMRLTGEKGRGNVCRKMWALVDLGLCKGIKGRHRSIRPSYMRLRNHE